MVKYKSITMVSKLLLFISLFFAVMTIFFAFYHHKSFVTNSEIKVVSEDVFFNAKKLSEIMNIAVFGDMKAFDQVNRSFIGVKYSFKKIYGKSAEYELPDEIADLAEKLNGSIVETQTYIDSILSNRELFEIANNRKNSLSKTFQELIFVSDKAIVALKKNKGSSDQIFFATKLQYYFQSLYSLVLQSYNTNIDPKQISSDFMEHSSIADEILRGLIGGNSSLGIKKVRSKSVRGIFSVLQASYESAQVTLLERLSGSYEIKEYSINLENNNLVMSNLLEASYALSSGITNYANSMLINSMTLGVSFAVSIIFFVFTILSFFYDAKLKFTSYFNDSSVIVEESKKVNNELALLLDEVSPLLENDLSAEASVRSNAKTVGVARAFNYAVDKLKGVIDSESSNKIILEKSISNLAKLNKNIDTINIDIKKIADGDETVILQINSHFSKIALSIREIKMACSGENAGDTSDIFGSAVGHLDNVQQALDIIEQSADECIKLTSAMESGIKNISESAVKTKVSTNKVTELLNRLNGITEKMDEVTSMFKES